MDVEERREGLRTQKEDNIRRKLRQRVGNNNSLFASLNTATSQHKATTQIFVQILQLLINKSLFVWSAHEFKFYFDTSHSL